MNDDLTCIHTDRGLCPKCQAEYDLDPEGWLEYGEHQDGIARWQALKEEIAAVLMANQPEGDDDPDLPF